MASEARGTSAPRLVEASLVNQVPNQAERGSLVIGIGRQQLAVKLIRVFEMAFVAESAGQFQFRGVVGRISAENFAEQANGALILAIIQVGPPQLELQVPVAGICHESSLKYANCIRVVLLAQSIAAGFDGLSGGSFGLC
jgi:hypothetical protein